MLELNPQNTAVATVGNGTLLAAALLGGFITRTGPVGAFTDTFDTTANIIAALGPQGGFNGSWELQYSNQSAQSGTLAAGDASTTISGNKVIPGATTATILITVNAAAGTITAVVLFRSTNA